MRELTQQEIDQLKQDEGFRGEPYNDHLGKPTIGFGTLLPLTEAEGELLLQHRWDETRSELRWRYKSLYGHGMDTLPTLACQALDNMAYQLGVPGVMAFKRMWAAIDRRDFGAAADEMLDSKWHGQTPQRCERLAGWMREAG